MTAASNYSIRTMMAFYDLRWPHGSPRQGRAIGLRVSVSEVEGNRIPMTSLEGCPHIAVMGSDLGVRVAADSRC
jgi:hypothetical protein